MGKKHKFIILLTALASLCPALLAAAGQGDAAPFSLPSISNIANAIKLTVPVNIGINADNDSTWSWKGARLRVCTDSQGTVCHIGYRLFGGGMMRNYPTPAVLRFLERYALEMGLSLDGKSAAQRMDVDNVVITSGTLSMFRLIKDDTPFEINNIPRRMYKVSWTTEKGLLTITFPSDCQLLFGGSAVELETSLAERLPKQPELSDAELLMPWKNRSTQGMNGIRVADYGTYLSPLVGSKVYLVIRNSEWRPYFNASNKVRTITNMMLTGVSSKDVPLHIVLDKYGYKTDTLDVTLKQFVSYCLSEGCKAYIGIKTVDESTLTGTLFIYNEPLGYNHVLSFSFPTTLLSGSGGRVEARLYAYIPLHNVTEKFFNQNNYRDYNHEK